MGRPEEASSAFAAAINAGDLAAALGCWSEHAVIVGPDGSEARGQSALRTRFEQLIAGGIRLGTSVGDVVVGERVAVGSSRMTMTGAAGEELTVAATVVYVDDGDRWRIAIDRVVAA